MNAAYEPIVAELAAVAEAVKAAFSSNSPISILHGNWELPGVTKSELLFHVTDLSERISSAGTNPSTAAIPVLTGLTERLAFLRTHTIPHLPSQGAATSSFLITMAAIERVLLPLLVDSKAQAQKQSLDLKRAGGQIRGMETRIKDLSSRASDIDEMVKQIESAHEAADQLPTDLETLKESQKKVNVLLGESERDRAHIATVRESLDDLDEKMEKSAAEASAVLARCESAYSSATSLGLAAAFSERSKALDNSMWGWVGGLVTSLLIGGVFGSWQLRNLAEDLANPQSQSLNVGINLVLSILSVGGPIWFAWLSTKQIGQRFRLSEDYAFKASISRAYEGYRREAARIDPELEKQLLGSALSRLDEQPLRLVENDSFGSPWHEFLASDVVKDAVKSVPGFVEKVTALASAALHKKSAPAAPPIASNDSSSEQAEAKV